MLPEESNCGVRNTMLRLLVELEVFRIIHNNAAETGLHKVKNLNNFRLPDTVFSFQKSSKKERNNVGKENDR